MSKTQVDDINRNIYDIKNKDDYEFKMKKGLTTGYSAAIAIASKIFKGDEKTLKGYKQFLSGGCSMHPIDLLKLCGIDMESPQVIQEALDVFGKLLEEWD